ncbi:MAG: hypothetical protein ACLP7P_19335 [Rhodomicrobium sp.]
MDEIEPRLMRRKTGRLDKDGSPAAFQAMVCRRGHAVCQHAAKGSMLARRQRRAG